MHVRVRMSVQFLVCANCACRLGPYRLIVFDSFLKF